MGSFNGTKHTIKLSPTHQMNKTRFLKIGALAFSALGLLQTSMAAPSQGRRTELIHEYSLPSFSLLDFGYSLAEITAAQVNGLTSTDLPAIGSGVQLLEGNHFLSVTDRGPNGDRADGFKYFPLPQFTPTIVSFRAIHDQVVPEAVIPLVNDLGQGVTGIPNSATADTTPFLTPTDATPLPFNPDGMDIEDVHTLPGGGFILVEEYAPSVVIADAAGHVLRRYTPAGKTLAGANYTVNDTLPVVFNQRRANRGFEGLAVANDGLTAYIMTQSPMGSTSTGSPYRDSSLIRVLRLNISNPLNLQITGEFLFQMLPASDFPGNAPRDLKISACAWVSPDRLLVTEGTDKIGFGGHKVVLLDLTAATDVLTQPDASAVPLVYEKLTTDFATLGITLGSTSVVADLINDLPQILERKLEGMTILNANEIVISSDNDFGIGDVPGATTKVYTIRLSAPLH